MAARCTVDGRTEVHVLSFDTRAGYDAYLADPDRAALRPLLAGLDIQQRVLPVTDVRRRFRTPRRRPDPGP